MRIAYDKESHGFFMRLKPGDYVESEEITPGIVVDFDAAGEPIAIELEDVRGFMNEDRLERITQPRIRKGADLREYRERLGMTQEELADKLEIPRNTIARWERGELAIEKTRLLELALSALSGLPKKPPADDEWQSDHALRPRSTIMLPSRKTGSARETVYRAAQSGQFVPAHGKKQSTGRSSHSKRKK